MHMLKFGYGIVLDGLPDIPEFHLFLVASLDAPRSELVQMLYSYFRNPLMFGKTYVWMPSM